MVWLAEGLSLSIVEGRQKICYLVFTQALLLTHIRACSVLCCVFGILVSVGEKENIFVLYKTQRHCTLECELGINTDKISNWWMSGTGVTFLVFCCYLTPKPDEVLKLFLQTKLLKKLKCWQNNYFQNWG